MGADLITMTVVADDRIVDKISLADIKAFLADDENVRAIFASSGALRDEVEMTADFRNPDSGATEEESRAIDLANNDEEIRTARAILEEGADSLIYYSRVHNAIPMGHDLTLFVGGGLSWGDDPYEGYSSEVAFTDAALSHPPLNALVGLVGAPHIDTINEYLAQRA
jgi:hypothetical protein